jgi:CheY-like chemotaxis protein
MEKEAGSLSSWQAHTTTGPEQARILVIEDNADNMELMLYVLTAFGYVVDAAYNGREGLAKLTGAPPDLIICDLQMPVLDGYQFARELKRRPDFRNIPLVAVTATAMVGEREKILACGFQGYFSKPIDPERFIAEIALFLPPEKRSPVEPG